MVNTRRAPASEPIPPAEAAQMWTLLQSAVNLLPAPFRAAILGVPAPCETCGVAMVKVRVERPGHAPESGLGYRRCSRLLTLVPMSGPLRVRLVE